MTSVTNTKYHHRIARHALRRRIADAAVKRFVANAQRALPRDGPREVRRARRLVAILARQERARGGQKPQPNSSCTASPDTEPPPSRIAHHLSTTLALEPMNLVQLPNLNHRKASNNGHSRRSIVAFDRQAPRAVKSADRRRVSHRAKPRTLHLGHVHLKVRDLNRSVPFYTRLLGLRLTEWAGRYVFLAAGDEHHSLALEEVGRWAVNPSRRAVGVAHVAFQVPDRAAFAAMRKTLKEANLPFISRNNGISWAMRFKDPDGNEIEIYVDRRHSPDGTQLWGGRWHGPLPRESEPTPTLVAAA